MRSIAKILLVMLFAAVASVPAGIFAQDISTGGCIHVYDDAGQYLGVLVDRGKMQDEVVIFIPGINKFATIEQTAGEIESTNLSYDSEGCSGIPYFSGGVDFIRKNGAKYYLGGTAAKSIPRISTRLSNGECLTWSPPYDKLADMFPVEEIDEGTIPFTLPVTLPLRYEYQ